MSSKKLAIPIKINGVVTVRSKNFGAPVINLVVHMLFFG